MTTVAIVLIVSVFAFAVLGVPLAWSLGLSSLCAILTTGTISLGMLAQRMYTGGAVYPICSMSEKAAYYSQDVVDRRMALIVEVITDEGISGWGEGFCSGQNPLILKAIVDNAYTPKLIGRDPFDNDVIYETLYNMSRSYGQSGSAIIALSAIDVALWDIRVRL